MIIMSYCFEIYQIYFMTLCLERKKKKRQLEEIKKPRWVFLMLLSLASTPTFSQNGTNQPNAWSLRPTPRCADHKREKCERRQFHFSGGRETISDQGSDYLHLKHAAEIQVSNLMDDALEIVAPARFLAWWCRKEFSAFPSTQQVHRFCLGSLYWAVMAHISVL